jgi:magnesium and cobalt transporter
MIQSIVDFNDTVARQIMTPRIDVVGLEKSRPLGEAIKTVLDQGYSRLPVFDGDLDHIVGFIVGKDLLQFWGQDLAFPLPESNIRPIALVPGNKKIVDILSELRYKKSHLAVVLDEYGGTAGLVTFEWLMERITGDLRGVGNRKISVHEDGSAEIDGLTLVRDVNEQFGLHIDEETYTTLGGFVLGEVGRKVRVGDTISVEGRSMRVIGLDGLRVARLWVSRPNAKPPEDRDDDA